MVKRLFVLAILLMVALPVRAQDDPTPILPAFDPANFTDGVANPYFPLTPGTLWLYDGGSETIRVYVMHETREVFGIACVVVRDTVWEDGELIEDTYDWYAQDNQGNVWYMGEESVEYEDGEAVSTAGSWEAGVDGARPGIIMWAEPTLNAPYYQEYYVGEAEDAAAVIALDGTAAVAYGEFEELVVIQEWNPLEPGHLENKYYAAEVGLVLEETVDGDGQVKLLEMLMTDDSEKHD